jgi:hypothetical protein
MPANSDGKVAKLMMLIGMVRSPGLRHARIAQGKVYKILAGDAVKPRKVRHHLERRDAAFERKMANVLCVYRGGGRGAACGRGRCQQCRDHLLRRKTRHQAISNTAADLPPEPGAHTTFACDHEYKRHSTACWPGSIY